MQLQNKFINNIKIIGYKCFDNFEAGGFQKVNLIGGLNNVGKTAFIEACCLMASGDKPNTISDFPIGIK